ncbi:hypothetical protein ACQZSR_18935 [Clostridioides difficile]
MQTIEAIGTLLNNIFVVSSKNYRNVAPLEMCFYKYIYPMGATDNKKVTRINKIERYITLNDIKNELDLKDSDRSLEHLVRSRKDKLLQTIDRGNKEILLNGLA